MIAAMAASFLSSGSGSGVTVVLLVSMARGCARPAQARSPVIPLPVHGNPEGGGQRGGGDFGDGDAAAGQDGTEDGPAADAVDPADYPDGQGQRGDGAPGWLALRRVAGACRVRAASQAPRGSAATMSRNTFGPGMS